MKLSKTDNQRGFTLIELMMVVVLLSVLSVILFSSINTILRSKQAVETEREHIRVAQFVFEKIGRELSARSQIPLGEEESSSQPGSPNPSNPSNPYSGAANPFLNRPVLFGKNESNGDVSLGTLRFVSTNSAPGSIGSYPRLGVVEIRYFLIEEQRQISSRERGEGKRYILVRQEVPADVKNNDLKKARSFQTPLAEDVSGFMLRFQKNGAWVEEWTEASARLPEAIEITLQFGSEETGQSTYRTAFPLSKQSRPGVFPGQRP